MGTSLKFSTDGLVVRLWFVKYLNFRGIFSYTANQNIVAKKITNFLPFLHCSFPMDGVDFVTIWSGEIPRLTKRLCLYFVVVRSLGFISLDFFGSNVKHATKYLARNGQWWEWLLKAERLWGTPVLGPGVLHAPQAANVAALGYPLPRGIWELGMRTQQCGAQS